MQRTPADPQPTAVITEIRYCRGYVGKYNESQSIAPMNHELINRGWINRAPLPYPNKNHNPYTIQTNSRQFLRTSSCMASNENMTIRSPARQIEDGDSDIDDIRAYDHLHQLNLSRLSMCSSHSLSDAVEKYYAPDEFAGNGMDVLFPTFSSHSLGGDADEELSASDFDDELGYSSLPPTPPYTKKRSQSGMVMAMNQLGKGEKEYASENEVHRTTTRRRRRKRRSSTAERGWILDGANSWESSNHWNDSTSRKKWGNNMGMATKMAAGMGIGSGGESESSGVVVITRPKGGSRSLCMGLEEVKACRDLGFELEHERMLEMPSRVSISASTLDTSSGGNSPIASWCISSPGDDPRDVKARLKVWAQAVAIASASRPTS